MRVIADATPLHYLILIDHVNVLPVLYGHIIVPQSVALELQHTRTPAPVRIWFASSPPWLEQRRAQQRSDPALLRLGAGEREAILLAQELRADILLMDDQAGRREAERRALTLLGTLGILAHAADHGLLDLPTAFTRLQATNFRVAPVMLQALLARAAARKAAAAGEAADEVREAQEISPGEETEQEQRCW